MASFTDSFADGSNLDELLGSEIASGELRNKDLDEGVVLDINGTSQYGTATGYKGVTGTSAMSVMGWFKTTDNGATAADNVLIYWGTGTSAARHLIGLEGGVLWDRCVANTINGGSNLADGQWHHFALTNPSSATMSQFSMYIDGVEVATTPSGSTTINIGSTDDLTIGALPTPTNYFTGSLDDLRLYSRELTADEIYALVHGGIEPSTTSLQGHWKFNDGSGTSAADSSGNTRTLALSGTPTWSTTHKPFYNTRSRTTSNDLITASTSTTPFKYTSSKKPAGDARFQFSADGTTWKNANGDTVSGYGAYDFDGVNDIITVPDDNELSFGDGSTTDSAFSVVGWYFLDEPTTSRFISKFVPSGDTEWSLRLTASDEIAFYLYDNGTSDRIGRITGAVAEALDKKWVHVVATYDGSSSAGGITIYINGIASDISDDNTGSYAAMHNTTVPVYIMGDTGVFTKGKASDVRVYAEELTSTEIYDLYAKSIDPDDTNLIAHYKMNGNANDSSGNGHNGTASGAVNTTAWYNLPAIGTGELEDANTRSFDGTNDQVSIADNDVFSFGDGSTDSAFSVSAWVNLQEATNAPIISKNATSNEEWFLITNSTDKVIFQITDNSTGGRKRIVTDASLPENKWVLVTATYDGSSASSGMKIYMNGMQMSTTTSDSGSYTAMENKAGGLTIGHDSVWIGGIYAKGRIANVAIWNDVRTQAEIIEEVEQGYTDLTDANILGAWHLNDEGSTTVNAVNPGTYDGTISGASLISDPTRPVPALPVEQELTLSGYTNDFYYRLLTDSHNLHFTYALTAMGIDYLSGGRGVQAQHIGNLYSFGGANFPRSRILGI